jgi:flagellar protein FliS
MFGSAYGGANAYAKVGMETGVVAASPHKLIVMLFDGALAAIVTAMQEIQSGKEMDISAKGHAISKAISIIETGLRASLDKNVGGEIAQNLDALYDYMSRRLLIANAQNDIGILTEVQTLLKDLRAAWEAIEPAPVPQAAAPTAQDPLIPATPRLMKA